ncbi:hypothetical protein BESB_014920 [Besnoitia besnoiti]|uniref:Uncharacterized protein n=1 Tax=Besnoitia besnoiti TaxID=94643 RepID=A0A2A9M4K4_BESBE|nr:hypothetical protein BESB_014920 [Besnoitia besnoiti]PFH32879.1 hypothetical protein BESB_014920 [Besnoitia besnoiti]
MVQLQGVAETKDPKSQATAPYRGRKRGDASAVGCKEKRTRRAREGRWSRARRSGNRRERQRKHKETVESRRRSKERTAGEGKKLKKRKESFYTERGEDARDKSCSELHLAGDLAARRGRVSRPRKNANETKTVALKAGFLLPKIAWRRSGKIPVLHELPTTRLEDRGDEDKVLPREKEAARARRRNEVERRCVTRLRQPRSENDWDDGCRQQLRSKTGQFARTRRHAGGGAYDIFTQKREESSSF